MHVMKIDLQINVEYNDLEHPSHAYAATFDDYDGAPDADFHPVGTGASPHEAVYALLDKFEVKE